MKNLWHDLHYALRQLRKNPGFASTAVITLALGIAATSTIFSWINSTLFNPIPGAAHTGNMISVMMGNPSDHPSPPFSYPDYVDLRAGTGSFTGMLAYHDDYMAITGSDRPVRIYGALTSANYFEVLGVKPILGTTLISTLSNEREGAPLAVLGYDLWRYRYGADPAIVGKIIQINLHNYTVAGVAPRGFQGCKTGLRAEVFLPLGMGREIWNFDRMNNRSDSWLQVLGVLRRGATSQQADSELNLLMGHIVDRFPAEHRGNNRISTDPLWRSPFGANVFLSGTLPILLALAAVLLLLACANVANLLLVRSVSRRREFAIRLSMGASRFRLVRQLMIENLLIALSAGAVALGATFWTASTLGAFVPSTTLPLNLKGSVDATVVGVIVLVSTLTALVAGVIPALRASALSPATVLKDEALSTSGGARKSRLTAGLVVAQVALSLVLLACAGLFVRSLQNAESTDPGFDPNHVAMASFDLEPMGYSGPQRVAFERQLTARVSALPSVRSVTLADFSPLNFTIRTQGILPEGYVPRPHESIEADSGSVAPNYLATLHTPLIAGREFTDADSADSLPVLIVNQALVDRFWRGENAIGKHVELAGRSRTVVGVAANGKYRRLENDDAPLVLMPLAQRNESLVTLQVRVVGDPAAFAPVLDETIHQLNPNLPVFNLTTLKSNMQIGNVFERIVVIFAGAFGLVAMLLAAVGVYAVVSYTTRQRTHEIGIRMALGASRGDVYRQTLRQGARLTLMGLAAGLVASLAFTRLLRGMLFGVSATDWFTFAMVAIALSGVALAACLLPARRAASVDPMQALHTE